MSSIEPRPYHHGDLRRALIEAAGQLLEAEGPDALSLRAVARDAGVSPAAPYHHFEDKSELLTAVADKGYEELAEHLRAARAQSLPGHERMTAMHAAYASFAASRRALYRLMTATARTRSPSNPDLPGQAAVVQLMSEAVSESRLPEWSETDELLAGIAAWAAIHGLADLSTFKVLEPIKARLGGEQAFLKAVMEHLGVFGPRPGQPGA